MQIFRAFLIIIIGLAIVGCKENRADVNGTTFNDTAALTQLENPTLPGSSMPRLYSNDDRIYLSWTETKDTFDTLKYAVLEDGKWGAPVSVTSGTDWFTNWADFPAITENSGNILTNILQKSATGTYTYDVKLNLYSSESNMWNKNIIAHSDGTQSEHGFVSMLPYKNDSFFITWLDGRNTVGGHEQAMNHEGSGAMTLRSAVVKLDGNLSEEFELDKRVCDCCNTAAANTALGPVVVYRDRSENEIRDISIVRWENDQWTQPQTIGNDHWKIAGCPVNGPAVASLGNDLVVAWYTAANEIPKINVVFSTDAGKTFGKVIEVDGKEALGRVDVVLMNENEAVVSWMKTNDDRTSINAVKVSSNALVGTPILIAETNASRSTGFPQMEKMDETLFFAWTHFSEANIPSIETVYISEKAF